MAAEPSGRFRPMAAAERGPRLTEFAPAKVNLYLHLRGLRADGYHLLESLAVFPKLGDWLEAEPAQGLSLTMDGPFGGQLSSGSDNLVLKAAAALAGRSGKGAALKLEKALPVASGIGGGSSDAAACLRLLARLWGVSVPPGLGERLGADVPVCLSAPQPTVMAGVGEQLSPAPAALPPVWIVLANPLRSVETRAVFAETPEKLQPAASPSPPGGFLRFEDLIAWLAAQRNDLAPAAVRLCPQIRDVLAALAPAPLARMSGSGATCFALHPTQSAAERQAEAIRKAEPGWWVAAAPVLCAGQGVGVSTVASAP